MGGFRSDSLGRNTECRNIMLLGQTFSGNGNLSELVKAQNLLGNFRVDHFSGVLQVIFLGIITFYRASGEKVGWNK